MSTHPSDSKLPLVVTLAFVVAGLIVGFVGSAFIGAVISGLGVVPSGWAMWAGMQQKTQSSLGLAILLMLCALGAAALLIIVGVVDLF